MHHPFFEIVTDSNPDYSVNDALLIQYSRTFWGYVVYNTTNATIYEWKIFDRKPSEISLRDEVNSFLPQVTPNQSFNLVRVINYSHRTIFMPDVLQSSDDEKACWNFTLGVDPDETIRPHEAPHLNGKYLHGVEKDFFDVIVERFKRAIWIPYAATHVQSADFSNLIRLTIIGHTMFVAVQKEHQYLLHQSYPFETPEDILYLLLKIITTFSLDSETIVVELDDFIDIKSAITRLLKQYIRNINWIEVNHFKFPLSQNESFTQPLAHIDRLLKCVS